MTRLADLVDSLLTRERLTVYPLVVVVLFVVVWAISLRATTPLPDFLARWTAGRMVLDGQVGLLYDPGAQSSLQAALGADRLSWFVSPPYVALLFVPLGALPYGLAAVLWTALSLGLLTWCARALSTLDPRLAPLGRPRGLLVAASCQPVLELVGAGQDTALVLAALVGAAVLLQKGLGSTAGLVLSVGVVKPHLVVLAPLALLLARAWRPVAAFIAAGAAVAVLSTAALGWGPWLAWRDALASPLYSTEVGQGQAWKNASASGLLHYLLGPLPGGVATVVSVLAAVAVLVVTTRRVRWRHTPPWLLLVVVVPLATVLVSPHVLVYDLVIVVPAAALAATGGEPRERLVVVIAYVLLFLAPLLHLVATQVPWLAVLGAPWVCLTVVVLWWRRLRPAALREVRMSAPTR